MISIAILCGGKSTRFKSNKVVFPLKGKPMLQIVHEILKEFSDDIFLQTSDRNIDLIKENIPGLENIFCDIGESNGSLVGIFSAMEHARHDRVFIVGCDMPFIDPMLLKILIEIGSDVVVARWEDLAVEPLGAIYSKKHISMVKDLLDQEEFRINRFLEKIPKEEIEWVDIDDLIEKGLIDKDCFININKKEDLERLPTDGSKAP